MKLVRLAIAVAVGASALVGVQANAAPPCKLLTDAAGDAFFLNGAGPVSNSLDITSADIASDAKRITAVIRVKKLAASDPAFAPTGQTWSFDFVGDGRLFTFTALTDPTGVPSFLASVQNPTTKQGELYGSIPGKFDLVNSEIRMTADLSMLAEHATIKKSSKITGIAADAGRILAIPYPHAAVGDGTFATLSFAASDLATSPKTYVAGSKTCVTVNK